MLYKLYNHTSTQAHYKKKLFLELHKYLRIDLKRKRTEILNILDKNIQMHLIFFFFVTFVNS